MPEKYRNLPCDIRTVQSDPFAARRSTGPRRPKGPVAADEPSFPEAYDPAKLYWTWLGHASVLLVTGGVKVLVDPVLSKCVGPFSLIGPKRFPMRTASPAELPAPDVVLITHNHFDHLDYATVRALDAPSVQYVVPSDVEKHLVRFGVDAARVTSLGWYETAAVCGLTVTLLPTYHNSHRGIFTKNRTLWGSYFVESAGRRVYFTGDGAYTPRFKEIGTRYGAPDIVFAECGQYGELWHSHHMFPEESVEACLDLGAKFAVPVHWGAYALAEHAWDEPPRRFALRAKERGLAYAVPVANRTETLG